MLRELWLVIGLGLLLSSFSKLWAQDEQANKEAEVPDLELNSGEGVLYDARSYGFDRQGNTYLFDGDVVLIGGGYVITADKILVEYQKKELTATGHVLFIHQNQIFTGERVHIRWESGDFRIQEAVLVANDAQEIEKMTRQILGQSAEELNYESARVKRLEGIEKEKSDLREMFRLQPELEPGAELVTSYQRLLEQQRLVRESKAPAQGERDPERRQRYERRRTFWEKARAEAAKNALPRDYYFKIEGEVLERVDGHLYRADDATFTPCFCEADETPAWAFQAAKIEAQQEGYIDLFHPILKIKGLPVLYLPYLKLPLKAKRQSGFLMPSVQTGETKNGVVYTQPVFFDLGKNADATLTTDIFQKRGTRLGLETRYEARQYSGFRYQIEGIRDSSWLQLASERQNLLRYHLLENPYCGGETDPIARQACEQKVRENLAPPSNTQRGKQEWEGRYFLAPRLSLVSKGSVISDHRYVEDLYLPENFITAFANLGNATQFSSSRGALQFDGKDFYSSLGLSYGDQAINTEKYSGQQAPLIFQLQSRYFRLLPDDWLGLPIYAELQARSVLVDERRFSAKDPYKVQDISLGDGSWQRYAIQTSTPLLSESIVRIDHFAEAELRAIEHQGLNKRHSTIRSWRTGFTLNLPIDGTGALPAFMQSQKAPGTTYVQHLMNWSLSASVRPVVVRDGPYGDIIDAKGAPLVYFPSDRKVLYSDDRDVPDEDTMVPHQRLTLSTQHRWQAFDRLWRVLPAQSQASSGRSTERDLNDLKAEALRELRAVKDQLVQKPSDMYKEEASGQVKWYVPRYASVDSNRTEPVWFNASISYDYQQEKLRRKTLERNDEIELQAQASADPATAESLRQRKVDYFDLPEPWQGPFATLGLNYRGLSLTSALTYNIYERTSSSLSFALGLPPFYSSQLGLGYVLEKTPELNTNTNTFLFKRTKTVTMGLTTRLIPYVTLGANLIRKQVEDQKGQVPVPGSAEAQRVQYGTSYQIAYDDLSGCWGIQFLREKDLNQNEEDANYILQLAVIFLGNRRAGDVSPSLEREFGVNRSRN